MISKIQSKWRLILGFLIIMGGLAFSENMYIGVPIVVVGLGFAFWQTLREKKSKRGSI
jgi:hypothetical protein